MKLLLKILMVLVVIIGIGVALLPTVIKNTIETKGTEVVGAEVDLQGVGLHLWPLGLSLKQMQITDPTAAEYNLAQFGLLDVRLDLSGLVNNQVIVSSFTLTQLALNSARDTAGSVVDKKEAGDNGLDQSIKQWAAQLPDFQEILEKEPLETTKRYDTLMKDVETLKASWDKRLADLPTDQTFADYQARIHALKGQSIKTPEDVLAMKNALSSLKEDIKQDKQHLQAARRDFLIDKKLLVADIVNLKAAPKKDMAYLSQKYQFDKKGLVNVTQLLLGQKAADTVAAYSDTLEKWLPIIQRLQGNETQAQATPEGGGSIKEPTNTNGLTYLVQEGTVEWLSPLGTIEATLSSLPWPLIEDKPGMINLTGTELKAIDTLTATVLLDAQKALMRLQADYGIKGLQLSPETHSELVLNQGTLKVEGKAIQVGDWLESTNKLVLDNLKVDMKAEKETMKRLANALEKEKELEAELSVKGQLSDPKISFHTSLDEQLKQVLASALKAQQQKWLASIETALWKKVGSGTKNADLTKRFLEKEPLRFDKLDVKLNRLLNQQAQLLHDKQKAKAKKSLDKAINKQLEKWL